RIRRELCRDVLIEEERMEQQQTRRGFLTKAGLVAGAAGLLGLAKRSAAQSLKIGVMNGPDIYNVKHYGAKGDGSTDDTTAIQNCINAAPEGSTVYFPVSSTGYKVVGSGSAIFTIDKVINLLGSDPFKTKILVDSGVSTSRDVFYIAPSASGGWVVPPYAGTDPRGRFFAFMKIEGIGIEPISGNPARHGLHFDLTVNDTDVTQIEVYRCVIW